MAAGRLPCQGSTHAAHTGPDPRLSLGLRGNRLQGGGGRVKPCSHFHTYFRVSREAPGAQPSERRREGPSKELLNKPLGEVHPKGGCGFAAPPALNLFPWLSLAIAVVESLSN